MSDPETTPEDRALTVKCPDCMAPEGVSCGDVPHADRLRLADLQSLDHGVCALCGRPMVRGTVEDAPVDAWHPDEADAAVCPPIPDPKTDWEGYAFATNPGLTPGHPGAEHFIESPPCGHVPMEPGCGGCDPSAIDFVILEDGTRRAYDPAQDLALPADATPEAPAILGSGPNLLGAFADAVDRAREDRLTKATRSAHCPECVNGKHVNCVGQALDPVTDALVPCTCTHGAPA